VHERTLHDMRSASKSSKTPPHLQRVASSKKPEPRATGVTVMRGDGKNGTSDAGSWSGRARSWSLM
jgi:hypothetical protein